MATWIRPTGMFLLFAVSGCAHGSNDFGAPPPDREFNTPSKYVSPKCPNFNLGTSSGQPIHQTTIQVQPTGNSPFALGDVTITFPDGAVTTTTTFTVSVPTTNSVEPAIHVTPTTTLRAPATLKMSYANCPWASSTRARRTAIVDASDPANAVSAGGANFWDANQPGSYYVVTLVNHFSEYALAYP